MLETAFNTVVSRITFVGLHKWQRDVKVGAGSVGTLLNL